MKILILLMLILSFGAGAKSFSQNQRVSMEMEQATILEVLNEIREQTGLYFIYKKALFDKFDKVSIEAENEEVKILLDELLREKGLECEVEEEVITFKELAKQTLIEVEQKKKELKGRVTDKDGNTLPGVSVVVKGTTTGVATDINGKYSLEIEGDKAVIVFSFVGMVPQEINFSGQLNQNIVLEAEAAGLDEVVVTGYFTRKKDSYTGAVTSVRGEELREITTGSVLSALSSLDPSFIQVVDNAKGSDPNSMPDFVIRGSGSLSSESGNLKNEYEGNPNSPTFIMDGFEVTAEKVFDLESNRVRSITILKDAAATAIYGSRAANGVVVIETVAPQMGELRVSYNGSLDLEVADLSDYNLMNAEEKFQFEKNSGLYDLDKSRPEWDESKLNTFNVIQRLVSRGIDTDWKSIPVRDVGIGQNHSLVFEGGDAKFRYSFDVNYLDKVGVMKGSGRKGMGVGIKLQYNYKKFKFMNYLSFDNVKSENSPYGDYGRYTYLNPYYYPYNEDGSISKILYEYTYYDRGFRTKQMNNWYYNSTLPVRDESKYTDFINNFSLEYDILEGLKFKTQISISKKQTTSDLYLPNEHLNFINSSYKGSYTKGHTDYLSYGINSVLSFTKSFGKHLFNGVVVLDVTEKVEDYSSTTAVNFPNQNLDHIGMGTSYNEGSKPTGSYDVTRQIGGVGNFNYGYDDRFLLDISVRKDGSSLFGAKNRWGTFGSIGLGWNLHKESFIENLNWFELLKIRGSWGLTGSQNFYAYQALAMLSYTDSSIDDMSYSGNVGAVLRALGNESLKWQRTEKRNVGIDFETKNRTVSGSVNIYSDISKDVLVNVSLAPSLGFGSYKENLGEVRNAGFELNLRTSILKGMNDGLRWDIFGSVVRNENELLSINNALSEFNKKQDAEESNKTKVRYMQGESINTIWANESLGIDPATGKEIFLDINGNVTNEWSADNYKPLGNTDPDFYGNFGTRLAYKGLELNANFSYSYGGDIYNHTLVDKVENIDPNENGDKRILTDKWTKPGDVAKFKGYDKNNPTFTRATSRFIEENNFIELRSLRLSYQFSRSQLKKLGLERLKLSAIGNNIYRMSTVEMERGTSYPFARRYSLALQVTF
ncbi:SusC/RagA family TonB-linked outer membrane protein [Ancylomarina sp. DW003]|nr:SusC/RagA family TonB-linked outer membrane protein [Ancylomarina sp. DW003]MDE5422132.1 SusC/RagA family TonB-linked outer membrane protein [Ancylomarina sp. DW003]